MSLLKLSESQPQAVLSSMPHHSKKSYVEKIQYFLIQVTAAISREMTHCKDHLNKAVCPMVFMKVSLNCEKHYYTQ